MRYSPVYVGKKHDCTVLYCTSLTDVFHFNKIAPDLRHKLLHQVLGSPTPVIQQHEVSVRFSSELANDAVLLLQGKHHNLESAGMWGAFESPSVGVTNTTKHPTTVVFQGIQEWVFFNASAWWQKSLDSV